MLYSIFFKSKEEADAVNSTLNNGVVVHMAYLITSETIGKTPEEVFNTDHLPLVPDPILKGWILDSKQAGRGIINERTVKFSLIQVPLVNGETGGWTIIYSGVRHA